MHYTDTFVHIFCVSIKATRQQEDSKGPREALGRSGDIQERPRETIPLCFLVQLAMAQERVSLSKLRYTRDRISNIFQGKPHQGKPLQTLVDDLLSGAVETTTSAALRFVVVRHKGKLLSLNNIRL